LVPSASFSFKEFMDRNGRYITEAERDARVEEMKQVRAALLDRLEEERQHKLDLQAQIVAAHEKDVKEGKANHHKKVHHHHPRTKDEHGDGHHPSVTGGAFHAA
jgi:uncharacterized protein (UPF0305 family)